MMTMADHGTIGWFAGGSPVDIPAERYEERISTGPMGHRWWEADRITECPSSTNPHDTRRDATP